MAKAEQAAAAVGRRIGELRTLRLLIVVVEDLVEEAAWVVAGQRRGLGAFTGGGGGGAGRPGGLLGRSRLDARCGVLFLGGARQRGEFRRAGRRQRRAMAFGGGLGGAVRRLGLVGSAVSTGGSAGFSGA